MAAAELSAITWDTPTFDSVVSQALGWTSIIGVFLSSSFLALKLGYEYFKYSLGAAQGNDVNVVWDWQEVVRVFVIITLIGCYTPLSKGVTSAISEINSITQPNSTMNDKLKASANLWYVKNHHAVEYELIQKLRANKKDAQLAGNTEKVQVLDAELKRLGGEVYANTNGDPDGDVSTKAEKEEGEFWSMLNPAKVFENALIGLTAILADAIKIIMGMFVKIIFKVGIILGPLVLAFSIFHKEKAIGFFNKMVSLGLVFTTLNILDLIFLHFYDAYVTTDVSVGESLAINLSMIGCYLSAFKLTSMFMGEAGLGSVMGRGMGAATAVAGAVAMGIGKAAGSSKEGSKTESFGNKMGKSIGKAANSISSSGNERAD